MNDGIFWAVLLKPFVLFAALIALAAIRYGVIKWMPPGRLKRFLLLDV